MATGERRCRLGLASRAAAQTGPVQDWLHRRAMTASGTGWAKFERGTSPVSQVPKPRVHTRLVNAESADAFGQVVLLCVLQLPLPIILLR